MTAPPDFAARAREIVIANLVPSSGEEQWRAKIILANRDIPIGHECEHECVVAQAGEVAEALAGLLRAAYAAGAAAEREAVVAVCRDIEAEAAVQLRQINAGGMVASGAAVTRDDTHAAGATARRIAAAIRARSTNGGEANRLRTPIPRPR